MHIARLAALAAIVVAFHWDSVQGRMMTQFGQLSTTTPRNDASPARGQCLLFLVVTVVFFAVSAAYARGLDRI